MRPGQAEEGVDGFFRELCETRSGCGLKVERTRTLDVVCLDALEMSLDLIQLGEQVIALIKILLHAELVEHVAEVSRLLNV